MWAGFPFQGWPAIFLPTFAPLRLISALLRRNFKRNYLKQLRYYYHRISRQVKTRISRVQFMILLAIMTGLIAGLAAVLLKLMVHELQTFLADRYRFHAFFLLFPMLGLVLTALVVHRFYKDSFEKGVGMVLKSIAKRSSYIGLRHNYMHIIASSLTVGMGGSAGLEAPIVATGSSIGSTVGRFHFMLYQERTLLIACGAAAGIASVFNAPIAGVIFAIEILLTETVVSYFIPLIIASVTGVLCSKIILNESVLFNFALKETFDYHNVPFYMLMGIGGGFLSLYYAYAFRGTEHRLHGMRANYIWRAVIAGALLIGLYFLFPPLFGEGYNSIKSLAYGQTDTLTRNSFLFGRLPDNWEILVFTGLVMLMKPVAAGVTLGGGGYGGNFAPSLFTGAFWGYFFSKTINNMGLVRLPESNFTLTGMAAILSGVMYCPLTAIFLIAEITNGYELIIPLMLVSSLSFFIVKHYRPYSMDTIDLALSGKMLTHEKEKNIQNALQTEDILERGFPVVSMHCSTQEVKEILRNSGKDKAMVTGDDQHYLGWISWKELIAEGSIAEKMAVSSTVVVLGASVTEIMEQFDAQQPLPLPVVNKKYEPMGFISPTLLLEKYREAIREKKDLYE